MTSCLEESFASSIVCYPLFALTSASMDKNCGWAKKRWRAADSLILDSINSVQLSWTCLIKSDKTHVLQQHVPDTFVNSAKHMLALLPQVTVHSL